MTAEKETMGSRFMRTRAQGLRNTSRSVIRFGTDRQLVLLLPDDTRGEVALHQVVQRYVRSERGDETTEIPAGHGLRFWELFEMCHMAMRNKIIAPWAPQTHITSLPDGRPFMGRGAYSRKIDLCVEKELRAAHRRYALPSPGPLRAHTMFAERAMFTLGNWELQPVSDNAWRFSHTRFSVGHLAVLAAFVLGDEAVLQFERLGHPRLNWRRLLLPRLPRELFKGLQPNSNPPVPQEAQANPTTPSEYDSIEMIVRPARAPRERPKRPARPTRMWESVPPVSDVRDTTRGTPTISSPVSAPASVPVPVTSVPANFVLQAVSASRDLKVFLGVRRNDPETRLVFGHVPSTVPDADADGRIWIPQQMLGHTGMSREQLVTCVAGLRTSSPWKEEIATMLDGIPKGPPSTRLSTSVARGLEIGELGLRLVRSKAREAAWCLERSGRTPAFISVEEAAYLYMLCVGDLLTQRDEPELYNDHAAAVCQILWK